ncbi:hypothetical protein N7537_010422 [Penicillium hordei]|uniref:Endonuclease/exonuclease/phosphatase domain-containing protein n=1 Tax=Penicillium hordei TaxID=40994 RepID=A0AAD6GWN9_9EURO|nr:uncharacterized protein N7537_010422 [Penicillium hordei]KAJ5593518.1 hypothetical protein N7537_010422 [Penicillium hordei]
MADPPTGAPEPLTTNTQKGTRIDEQENLEPTTAVQTSKRKRTGDNQRDSAYYRTPTTHYRRANYPHTSHSGRTERTRSWAAVASGTDKLQPRENHRRNYKDKNCVRISTGQSLTESLDTEATGNAFGRYLQTVAANSHVRTALSKTQATQDVQASAEAARNNTEWLTELGNDTRLVKARFGVTVHHIPTFGLDLERRNTEAIEKITNENDLTDRGFRIEDIAWLKKRAKELGTFASMDIRFDSLEAAEWMLNNGLLIDQRYIGRVEKCEIKKKRCFRCQGHGAPIRMLENNLRILQLNIMKSRAGMEALINGHQSQNPDILLIQEPSITAYRTHVNHSAWRLYQPTVESDSARFRSLIYVNRKLSTSSHRQVRCNHPDLTAIKIWTADSQFLIFSVYIPPVPRQTPDEASAETTLSAIHDTILNTSQNDNYDLDLDLESIWREFPNIPTPPPCLAESHGTLCSNQPLREWLEYTQHAHKRTSAIECVFYPSYENVRSFSWTGPDPLSQDTCADDIFLYEAQYGNRRGRRRVSVLSSTS